MCWVLKLAITMFVSASFVSATKCGFRKCPLYAECQPTTRQCICPSVDDHDKVYEPVCGSNGFTYNNEIELKEYACHNGMNIYIVRAGKCPKQYRCYSPNCHPESICNVTTGKCQCPGFDASVYQPACGTDGKDYRNKEELRYEACVSGSDVKIAVYNTCQALVSASRNKKTSNEDESSVNVAVPVTICVLVIAITLGIAWFFYHKRTRNTFNVSKRSNDVLLS
ncbi:agrin-like [Clytia hemisphaerica]